MTPAINPERLESSFQGYWGANSNADDHYERRPTASNLSERQHRSLDESLYEAITKMSKLKISHRDLPVFDGTSTKSFKSFIKEFEDMARLRV